MKTKYINIAVTAALLLYGCEKVVKVDLNKAEPQIVIQGTITDDPGPHYVSISRSVPVDNSNIYPPVSGASVVIKDITGGVTDVLTESTTLPGLYSTSNIQGYEGRSYQLIVQADGKEYTAAATMPAAVVFDSVTFYTNTFFGTSITNPVPNFRDPGGVDNYYYFSQRVNKVPLKNFFTFDDRLSDGRYISAQLFNDSNYIKKQDTVEVEMWCIQKDVFNYFTQIMEAQGRGNTGPVAAPSNPVSNISGGALGFFSAHTVRRREAVFK
ncbi:MAG: DUF4249 domain-containing protein [Ferruginibacter sp.]